MSARTRLTISFTILFGSIVIALAIAAYVLVRQDAFLRLNAALQVATGATAMSAQHELNEHSTKAPGEKDLQLVLDLTTSSELADTQILVREGTRIVAYKPAARQVFDLRTVPSTALANGVTVHGLQVASRILRAQKFSATYEIDAAKPIAPALAQLRRIRIALLVFVPIGLGIAGTAGYFLAKRSLLPLMQLAQTVDAVTSSNLSARVKLENKDDEIGTLGHRFNALLDRLEKSFDLQRQFMADASHQLRTPVTVALTAAQVTSRDSNATARDYKDSLQIIEHQMMQLRRTVEDMFYLSQADTASFKLNLKEMYLDDAIADAVRAAKALARKKAQILTVDSLTEAKCRGDADLLRQAILILLDNAVKFTPREGEIHVSLYRRCELWVCSVTDNGIGISETAQPQIFERFFRERRAGNESGGTGLGLAIAKSIADNHGGTLTLIESRPGRTTFEIAIPSSGDEISPNDAQANSLAVRM